MKNPLKISQIMENIAAAIDEFLKDEYGKTVGFSLLVFELGEPTVTNYISNCDRECMISALRETANRLENEGLPPTITKNVH